MLPLELLAGSRPRRVCRGPAGVWGSEDARRSAASPTSSNVCRRRCRAAGAGPPSGAEPQRPAALGPVRADEPRPRSPRRGRTEEGGAQGWARRGHHGAGDEGGAPERRLRSDPGPPSRPSAPPTALPAARLSPPFRRRARPPSRAPDRDSHWPAPARRRAGKVGAAEAPSNPLGGSSLLSPPLPAQAPPSSCHVTPSVASSGPPGPRGGDAGSEPRPAR